MDKIERTSGGLGFWSGFRLGLGFMAAVTVFFAAGLCTLFLVAWLAYGSMRDMAVAAVGGIGSMTGSAAHAVVDEAREGAGRVKDRVVDGASSAAQRVGETAKDAGNVIRDKAVSAGERVSETREVIRERAGGLVDRLGWGRRKEPEPAMVEPEKPPAPRS